MTETDRTNVGVGVSELGLCSTLIASAFRINSANRTRVRAAAASIKTAWPKLECGNSRKCTPSKEGTPCTPFGVRFSPRNVHPGYAKNAYPGLMFLHASGVRSPE